MKNSIVLTALLLTVYATAAQNVHLRHDTIFAYGHPYAKFRSGNNKPERYAVHALNGVRLIELHDGRVEVNGKQGYVVTFWGDKRQAMVAKDAGFPFSFIKEMVKHTLVAGMAINEAHETAFIKAHPMPDGYTDIEQLTDDVRKSYRNEQILPQKK